MQLTFLPEIFLFRGSLFNPLFQFYFSLRVLLQVLRQTVDLLRLVLQLLVQRLQFFPGKQHSKTCEAMQTINTGLFGRLATLLEGVGSRILKVIQKIIEKCFLVVFDCEVVLYVLYSKQDTELWCIYSTS